MDKPKIINVMGYNTVVKRSGDRITINSYNKINLFNYQVKRTDSKSTKGTSSESYENYVKSTNRARQNVFDIISCNVNVTPDYHGVYHSPKFVTLTFKENITALKDANAEFTKFNKRLSYQLYKLKKNVLKYIAVPEFQSRGAIHYHVLYFNLPYIDFKALSDIWGKGYLWVESTKDGIKDYALYIAKYINKTNSIGESNFILYSEKGLLNEKRYFCSAGLIRPTISKLLLSDVEVENMFRAFEPELINEYSVDNEFRGEIVSKSYMDDHKLLTDTLESVILDTERKMIDIYDYNKFKDELLKTK